VHLKRRGINQTRELVSLFLVLMKGPTSMTMASYMLPKLVDYVPPEWVQWGQIKMLQDSLLYLFRQFPLISYHSPFSIFPPSIY
jgi:hypothetical protein